MKIDERGLEVGDIVQLSGECGMFAHCSMVVTEPKVFGAMGYVTIPGQGQAFYRASWENMEYVGKAKWVDGSLANPKSSVERLCAFCDTLATEYPVTKEHYEELSGLLEEVRSEI